MKGKRMKLRVPNPNKLRKGRLDAPKTKVHTSKRTKLRLKILELEGKELEAYFDRH
jgi:hypothetical protein